MFEAFLEKGQNNFNKAMLMEVWAIINPMIHLTNRISKSLRSALVARSSLRDSSIISTFIRFLVFKSKVF